MPSSPWKSRERACPPRTALPGTRRWPPLPPLLAAGGGCALCRAWRGVLSRASGAAGTPAGIGQSQFQLRKQPAPGQRVGSRGAPRRLQAWRSSASRPRAPRTRFGQPRRVRPARAAGGSGGGRTMRLPSARQRMESATAAGPCPKRARDRHTSQLWRAWQCLCGACGPEARLGPGDGARVVSEFARPLLLSLLCPGWSARSRAGPGAVLEG